MKTITVNLNPSYPIYIDPGLLHTDLIAQTCKKLAGTWVIIADDNLLTHYAQPLQQQLQRINPLCHLISFTATELNKTREQKALLEDELFYLGCTRDTCLIALGGGITTDLVGFVAATFCRGVPAIYIPTTLLAMVDASIGGKTGVNVAEGKNLIGAFHQPNAVFIDVDVLNTLPKKWFNDGMAEVIKHALLADTVLLNHLSQRAEAIHALEKSAVITMIERSIAVKQTLVEQDEKEKGPRQLLNLGHTVAHAIEAATEHRLSHGQAVALGLLIETQLAIHAGWCNPSVLPLIQSLCTLYHLPTTMDLPPIETLIRFMQHDKKNQHNQIYFSVLHDIGKPYVVDDRYSHPLSVIFLTHSLGARASVIKLPKTGNHRGATD